MIEFELQGPRSQAKSRVRLVSALCGGRFPQAVLLEGPEGIGKKKLAIELVRALSCTDQAKRPCGRCFGCKMSANPEVVEQWLVPLPTKCSEAPPASEVKAGSTAKTVEDYTRECVEKIVKNPFEINYLDPGAIISVSLVRALTKRFGLKSGGIRCVIVAEADRMNTEAANAFLKTLEEVPPNTYFILTTSSRDALLETVRSRCLYVHLEPCSEADIVEELKHAGVEEPGKQALGLALGSPGRAMFFEPRAERFCELARRFVASSFTGKFSDALWLVQEEVEGGDFQEPSSANLFLDVVSFLLIDIGLKNAGLKPRLGDVAASLPEGIFSLSPVALNEALKAVQGTANVISGRSVSVLVALESLAVKLFDGYR